MNEIIKSVKKYDCNLIEITGGEPLIQENVHVLIKILCDDEYEILLETAGHMDIEPVDKRVKIVMDIKCPSSGESEKNLWSNIRFLKNEDEIKFVIGDRDDFEWARNVIKNENLEKICNIIFSPVYQKMNNEQLANWILQDHLPVRMQLQMHKYIWDPDKRRV